jgi:2'-5' RNA ligase
MFAKAWEEFQSKEFKGDFRVDHFALLKHNGRTWEVYKDFQIGNA